MREREEGRGRKGEREREIIKLWSEDQSWHVGSEQRIEGTITYSGI